MGRDQLSQTIRIDLIPDTPSEPPVGRKKRIVITARKSRQQSVAPPGDSSRAQAYHEFLHSVYDGAIITDQKGRITDVNERAVEFLDYSPAQFRQLNILDIISGADSALLKTLCANREDNRFTLIQAYCERRDHSLFPSEISVNRLDVGDMRLCFLVRDITVRRQAEEMLRTEHNAINNSGSGIAVANIAADLEYVNPAAAQMWGYAVGEDLLGKPVVELFADAVRAETMLANVMREQQNWTAVMKARRQDGTQFDVQVSAARNRNSEGELVGTVLSFVDVSDRQRAVAAEREAERQRVMLESLGAVTHHMGQPATVLLANLEMLALRRSDMDSDDAHLLKSSIAAAETLSQILHRLINVNEYKTTRYLEQTGTGDAEGDAESRILEI